MTPHVSEDELILHYYGEPAGVDIDSHLAVCHDCRDHYTRLQQVLNVVELPVPERGSDYEENVWNRLSPKIGVRQRLSWWVPRKWAAIAAMCALVVVAFVAGRYSPPDEKTNSAVQTPVRERVLVVAVGNHLERSQMVLVELKNLPDSRNQIDITDEQSFARDLLSANRLYRQTAVTAGETGLVGVLEDLERVLLEVVHSPSTITPADLDDIRQRIESQGLLFKMRVVESNLSDRAQGPAAHGGKQL
jgi:predicted anti-sigma-YlaC factor YlaD